MLGAGVVSIIFHLNCFVDKSHSSKTAGGAEGSKTTNPKTTLPEWVGMTEVGNTWPVFACPCGFDRTRESSQIKLRLAIV